MKRVLNAAAMGVSHVALVLLIVALIANVGAQGPDLVGRYAVNGMSAEGKPYAGELEILQQGTVYYVLWSLPQQDGTLVAMKGVGIVEGGALAIAFVMPPTLGIAVYPIVDGTITKGTWTGAGDDATYSETLKRLPADHPPPSAAPARTKPAGRLLQG